MLLSQSRFARAGWLARKTAFCLVALFPITLTGCTDNEPAAPAMPDDADGPLGGRPPDEQCLRRSDLTPILAPSELGGSRFAQLEVAGDQLYFTLGTTLYKVPAQGGQAQLVTEAPESSALPFSVRDDRILWATHAALFEQLSGGEPAPVSELPEPPASDFFAGTAVFAFEAQRALFVGSQRSDEDYTLYGVALDSGEVTKLSTLPTAFPTLAGEFAYWTEPSREKSTPYANQLLRAPVAGGMPTQVPVELGKRRLGFELIGVTPDGLFLNASVDITAGDSDASVLTESGIYRVPLTGGAGQKLVDAAVVNLLDLFTPLTPHQVLQADDGTYLRTGALQATTLYFVPKSGEPEKRLCLSLGQATLDTFAVHQGQIYLALSLEDESIILRHEL